MISFDCEQKIKVFDHEPHTNSTIQLSTRDHNFIFDMLKFADYSNEWSAFFEILFATDEFLKLGFGVLVDGAILKRCYPTFDFFYNWKNYVDIQNILNASLIEKNAAPDSKVQNISLAKACEVLLNAKLSKEETISNWIRRPLTDSQLQYAALDSEVLFYLYDSLKEKGIET
jgi:hypothetical protein